MSLQAQQQVAAEYEQLKDLMNTIGMFDNPMNAPDGRPIGESHSNVQTCRKCTDLFLNCLARQEL